MYHIEGMGLLGSILAFAMDEADVPFTWSDNDSPFSAWRVSTGLAYPDGSEHNRAGLRRWYEEVPNFPEAARAPYVYAHLKPPHKGEYLYTDYGPLRKALPEAVAVNVPAMVERARREFAHQRVEEVPPGSLLIVAHTTPERGRGYLWGWVAKVRFEVPAFLEIPRRVQPAMYSKAHRYNLTYAYPIPGTGMWWAGSMLKWQLTPRALSEPELYVMYEEWEENAERLLCLKDVELVELGQGWRPRFKKGDSGWAELIDGRWVLPPRPTDGLRNAHLIIDDLMDKLLSS